VRDSVEVGFHDPERSRQLHGNKTRIRPKYPSIKVKTSCDKTHRPRKERNGIDRIYYQNIS
jgi:hypothetical protein